VSNALTIKSLDKLFHIYRSSAGSGKTRTLAKAYLALALGFRADYFRHILAVTFTNKATQEMKDRILAYLNDFANGTTNELSDELRSALRLDEQTFRQYAQEAQSAILHKYTYFSISTIDAFFQKVIRSFTREAGLVGDYRLEVDQDMVLEVVIDNLMDELGNNPELTEWVVEFAKENLENERAWDVRTSLISFASEIFREEFKDIEGQVIAATSDRRYFTNLRSRLWDEKNKFFDEIEPLAKRAIAIMASHGWQAKDISYGRLSGLQGFLEKYAHEKNLKEFKVPSDRVTNYFTIARNWPSKSNANPSEMIRVAEEQLIPILKHLLALYDEQYPKSLSADVVLQNLYVFGLIADISRKLKEYKDENNLMLLADAPKFLNGVIQDSDTPFIYEKVGSFYKNYLIDEFQDTSSMQWKNFLPLLLNSLDQGYNSMVVGDVKQAIYRWRGGDLKLLQEEIEQHIGTDRVGIKELNSNFRSASSLVDFNNRLFEAAASIVAIETGHPISVDAYRDVAQKSSRSDEGAVLVKFIRDEDGEKWKDNALQRIPHYLEQLQASGVALRDIAILVRKNEEGQQIVAHLLNYKNSTQAKSGCRYDVVSNESLRLDGATTVNLLLAAMKYLVNPDDAIARAQLGFEFAKLHEPDRPLTDVFAVTNQVFFENNLPESFSKLKSTLRKLPLFELTETLVSIFQLGNEVGEIAYLLAFQNLVLEFYSRERNDLGAFLEWWEDNKHKKSIQVSGEVDAVQILTIHKAKGLQFKYVIVPFCAWSLDHESWQAPNLWVTADEHPFAEAGYLPVRYSSALQQTYFDDFYNVERTRCYLDNLNLLYVALTRAEQGLIVMAAHPDTRNTKRTVAQLLYASIRQAYSFAPNWNDGTQELNLGRWDPPTTTGRPAMAGAIRLSNYASSRWRDKLVIRQTAPNFFDQPAKHEKVNYGIHIHTVLSRISYATEIPQTLDRLRLEGLITREEQTDLDQRLTELLTNPQIASWFDTTWTVRTEIPILIPGGSESRIDRLLLNGKQAVVVDFKTGEPARADQKQVQEYMETLRKMNFVDVEGFLLYIKTSEVVSINTGRVKTVKSKDKHQLGLGF